ncbi:RDD family protein [Streptomyces sp. YU58]|uniref:RDD family protein n=1 Tax=Streptomyces sp. SX92 TaxID=3158972 RepID=UPI0027BAEEC7|nr:RDD family protein [Streptomyces coralus]WLW54664.1 RDD family protein [Streptomyces coralus]
MSAPTPAPGDDRPRDGYYPDPSIPGYVRYWNGAAWVPGTSRPAPTDGEPLAPPPGTGPAASASPAASAASAASASPAAPVEETGPHFFDEDPAAGPGAGGAQHGSRPEPASAWGADRSHQSGFGSDQERRVSWGSPPNAPQGAQQAAAPQGAQQAPAQQGTPQAADPRVPRAARPGDGPAQPEGRAARTDGTATIPPAEPDQADADSANTFLFRRPTAGPAASAPGVPGPAGPARDEGTVTFRALSPRTPQQGGAQQGSTPGGPGSAGSQGPQGSPGFGAGKAAAARAGAAQAPGGTAGQAPAGPAASAAPTPLSGPQQASPAASLPQQAPAANVPQQSAASSAPISTGAGGGQPSWAQQVHQLAGPSGDEQPAPWKPPVEDIFQAAARRQASAKPAGLGKRLAARLVDTVVLAGVTAVAAVPLGLKAIDHVNEKIDAAKLSGETVTVWLLDGTTSTYLGIVVAVLLLFGALYEALPTHKWGRTLGKKLLGLEVRDIEGHEPPSFGAALRRWLVYSVPGLLAIGVLGLLWGLFDRPWRQCWHDKAAHTFVAG